MRGLAEISSAIRAESQARDLRRLTILPIGELYAERLHSPSIVMGVRSNYFCL